MKPSVHDVKGSKLCHGNFLNLLNKKIIDLKPFYGDYLISEDFKITMMTIVLTNKVKNII